MSPQPNSAHFHQHRRPQGRTAWSASRRPPLRVLLLMSTGVRSAFCRPNSKSGLRCRCCDQTRACPHQGITFIHEGLANSADCIAGDTCCHLKADAAAPVPVPVPVPPVPHASAVSMSAGVWRGAGGYR